MRAELPWNVAGIPPEAREAARAAARREGLSVGEWLTRRILRSFSDLGEEPSAMALDSWGLPPSANSRRDTEEMLARVSRSEAESDDVYRRIEEQLRGVARRLDSAERSQSESNRIITKTASEMNIAAREQAQAFDQLGNHMVGLGDRVERVERTSSETNMKDAVKGLHQGLSRLADQISQTATQSASQVSSLANNLEQLAGRLGQLRQDVENVHRTLEQRVGVVEKTSQSSVSMLDNTVETIQHRTETLGAEQAAFQRREAETAGQISRLEDTVSRIENRDPDPSLDRRLDGIERSLGDLIGRLENPAPGLEDGLRKLSQRLDAAEKQHNELVAELRANLAAPRAPEPEPAPQPPPSFQAAPFPTPSFDAPPYIEPPPSASGFDEYGNETAFAPHLSPDPFAPVFPPPPDFPEPFAANEPPPPADNFLSAARRSARAAAAAQAESAAGSSFSWGGTKPAAAAAQEPQRSRLLIPGLIGAVIVFALIAAFFYGQHLRGTNHDMAAMFPAKPQTPVTAPPQVAHAAPANPVPASTAPFVTAPSSPAIAPGTASPAVAPKPAAKAPAPVTHAVRPAPIHPVPLATEPPLPKPAQSPLDRVTALANGGNPNAQTIVGLKYLDGEGVPANPAEAAKWLTLAAEHGQAVAQARLGTMYEHGQGVPTDMTKAAHWYQAAALQGNRTAMHNLAVALHQGINGKPDKAEAARWFSKAASLGLVDSEFNLAVLYERGEGVPQSLLDAYKWYSIAAAQGDAESKARLAVLETQMSDEDKAAAQHSAASFHPAPYSRAANVAPTLADLPPG